ncbi:MAG: hypothetical protein AB1791_23185 [Chloroflexota bacterium]
MKALPRFLSTLVVLLALLGALRWLGQWPGRPAGVRIAKAKYVPGANDRVLANALAVAAVDPRVQAVLGDIRPLADQMTGMGAMPGWLEDDACRQEWCVDLTFHAPDGSGRILHVFVNVQRAAVARVFYSRARAERAWQEPTEPVLPEPDYTDDCHQQYGWNVCWTMTAHDGINFRNATYDGRLIFSSIEIPQIEVWYPSWPGGYRDEIGYGTTVPPKFGTQLADLGRGFEVRQLFTEPFDWPNCICCYRYEQRITFNADGSFELAFLSYGPGCDDPSTYRPFWRIDLDLDGATGDTLRFWQEGQWVTAAAETELPLLGDRSPQGDKLLTFDDDIIYSWRPAELDPLGQDDGRFYLLRWRDGEGNQPLAAGAANTFEPPSQWLSSEPISEQNVVVWYIPFLLTKKGGPWWCMPDPAPDISPCQGLLRVAPVEPLSLEEPSILATPTPAARPSVTPSPPPTAVATSAPRFITGDDAVTIIQNAGCGNCHQIGRLGEAGKVGPDLSNVGEAAGGRVAGLAAADYLRQSILDPNAVIAPACPNGSCLPGIMPQDYDIRLSSAQLDVLVGFLLEQKASPTPVPIVTTTPPLFATAAPPTSQPTVIASPSRSLQVDLSLPAIIAIALVAIAIILLLFLWRDRR